MLKRTLQMHELVSKTLLGNIIVEDKMHLPNCHDANRIIQDHILGMTKHFTGIISENGVITITDPDVNVFLYFANHNINIQSLFLTQGMAFDHTQIGDDLRGAFDNNIINLFLFSKKQTPEQIKDYLKLDYSFEEINAFLKR